ncbi:MAG: hypothetical protein LBS17_05380 [Actinomycetes bacterium]|jgi:hypothetical protein|nr:hypothetical protein [Actinomycetes bacterium]
MTPGKFGEIKHKLYEGVIPVSDVQKLISECCRNPDVTTDYIILLLEYINDHGSSELSLVDYLKYRLELLKRYFETARYKRANNMIVVLEGRIEGMPPDWFSVMRAKIDIYTLLPSIIVYGGYAQLFVEHVNLIANKQARLAVVQEFCNLSAQYVHRHFEDGGKPNPTGFRVNDAIEELIKQNDLGETEVFNHFATAMNKLAGHEIYRLAEIVQTEEKSDDLEAASPQIEKKIVVQPGVIEQAEEDEREEAVKREEPPEPASIETIGETAGEATRKPADKAAKIFMPFFDDLTIELQRNQKILIIGESRVKPNDVCGIAKTFGLKKTDIEIFGDYEKLTNFDVSKLQWSNKYGGIIIGPVPHKMAGIEDASSLVTKLAEEGFPYSVDARTLNGELKLTKSSLKEAFRNLALHFYHP